MEAQLVTFSVDCQKLVTEYKKKSTMYKYLSALHTFLLVAASSTVGILSTLGWYNADELPVQDKSCYLMPLSWFVAIIAVFDAIIGFSATSILYDNAFWKIINVIDDADAAAPKFKTNTPTQNHDILVSLRKQKRLAMARLGTYNVEKYIQADEADIVSYASTGVSNNGGYPLAVNDGTPLLTFGK
jgi:hypothetical protein